MQGRSADAFDHAGDALIEIRLRLDRLHDIKAHCSQKKADAKTGGDVGTEEGQHDNGFLDLGLAGCEPAYDID